MATSQMLRGRARVVTGILLVLVIAVVPVGDVGLRLGLDAGIVLGALLWATPLPAAYSGATFPPGSPVSARTGSGGTADL